MSGLWLIIPAHGRVAKSRVCFQQLAEALEEAHAHAVVVAADDNLQVAREAGFHTLHHANAFLGSKWNAGFKYAADQGADWFAPFGSDDWIDPVLLMTELPEPHEVRCSRESSVVSEDGRRLARLHIHYPGGDGVRIYPRALLEPLGFEPCEPDRNRALDTCILRLVEQKNGPVTKKVLDVSPYQIVDWKTAGEQLNSYDRCCDFRQGDHEDPWEVLAGRYPVEHLDAMRGLYP